MNGLSEWWNNLVATFEKCFIREDRYMLLVDGIGITIKISLLAVVIGILIGLVIAFCNLSKSKLLNFIGNVTPKKELESLIRFYLKIFKDDLKKIF